MALLCFLLTAFGAEEPYHWPLDLPRALTSSFGEYRSGRFHMGIDLRTGGIGKPVFAAADGYVSRLRCSPYGYGKAVYLQLNDGHTAVYGHLDGFIPEYESYLRAAQHAREDYTVDLYPEAARFPVTKGQLIAYSGDTGVGVPHLHYELREGADCINPRLLDIDWPDTTRPEIRKILIAPRDPGDYVNGDILPLVVEPKSLGGGRYQCAPVSVSGTVGFGMDLVDPANGGATKLDIYRIEARVEDTLLFRSQRDRLSYDTYSGGAVTWHPFLMDQGRFQLLWQWPGNDAGIITTAINSGWLEMGAEPLVVDVDLVDFLGNTASVSIPLTPAMPPMAMDLDTAAAGTGAVSQSCYGEYLVLTARFNAAEPVTPSLVVKGVPGTAAPMFFRVDSQTFRAGYAPAEAGQVSLMVNHPRIEPYESTFHIFKRGQPAQTIRVGDLEITAPSNAPFGTLFINVTKVENPPASALPRLGIAYRLEPGNSPVDASLRISFPAPEDVTGAGVYRAGRSSWSAVSTRAEAGRLVIDTGQPGTFAILRDTIPPAITGFRIEPGGTARPRINATIHDQGSGIASIRMTANGAWLLAEYDPEENRLDWVRDEDLPGGNVVIELKVTDAAGNASVMTRELNAQS